MSINLGPLLLFLLVGPRRHGRRTSPRPKSNGPPNYSHIADYFTGAAGVGWQMARETSHMKQSEWFQRGWTLQELIAPRNVCFYEANWVLLGDKSSLSEVLMRKTGIPEDILRNEKSPRSCSIAQRMSWAAARTTSRVEDRAYSLMGLFNVNMPMIYGEKEQAFIRLQQQIIASSTDESIFAWDLGALDDLDDAYSGLIAKSPACFAGCGNAISLGQSKGFYINQFGLSVTVKKEHYSPGIYRAYLQVGHSDPGWQFALFLAKLPDEDRFARVKNHAGVGFVWAHKSPQKELEQIIIPMDITAPPERIYNGLWMRQLYLPISLVYPHNILARILSPDGRWEFMDGEGKTAAGIIRYCFEEKGIPKGIGWIGLGFDRTFRPICTVLNNAPYQQTEYKSLLDTTPYSVEWSNHPFFEMRRWGLCINRPFTSNVACGTSGLTIRISAELVMDANAARMRVPAKVWAFDITCLKGFDFTYVFHRIMSQSNVEMVEKYQLCYSADAYFGARPVVPLSDGQLEVTKVQHGNPDARFQLTLEPEVSFSARQGVLEATMHIAFLLTNTAPVDDATDASTTSTDGGLPIQMGSVAHVHSEGEFPQLLAGMSPFNPEKGEPNFSAKIGLAIEQIQKTLYNLAMVAKDVPPEDEPAFWGLPGDEELRRELRDSLSDLTPHVYIDVFLTALDRVRELCVDYERGKKEAEAGLV
ncbi:hypothetical protein PG984_007080 [Apiospora sp. TS-2023a]